MTEHPLGWVEHRLAWSPQGELGKWAMANPAILKIGGTLFVHGGISAEYASQSIERVNASVVKAMATADDSPASVLTDPLVTTDADAQAKRTAMKTAAASKTPEQELNLVLTAYKAERLILAHTPSIKGIQIGYGGRLADIDTGNSRYYGGPLSWLEIDDGKMIPHTVPRTP